MVGELGFPQSRGPYILLKVDQRVMVEGLVAGLPQQGLGYPLQFRIGIGKMQDRALPV